MIICEFSVDNPVTNLTPKFFKKANLAVLFVFIMCYK